ncbi:MAG: transglutaminase domain-containing protein, partial [Rickettsiales bacterium]
QLDEPVEKVDIRLLWPKDKPLYVRSLRGAVDAKVMETDASKVYHWEFPARLPYIEPDRTPGWFTARPEIEVTEFASWHDYARWEMQHYNTQGQLNEAVKAIAAEIAAKSTTPEEKMLHALHYVQQKAVYGESAYYVLPRTPAQTLARGFGDCKDKTFLLLALLEALGIKAHAVAANVEGLHRLEASLPMPWHFNHVLAYVELEGTSYWLDSTQPPTATLSELESGDKGDVLILAENTHAPMTMPLPLPDAPLHAKWEVYDATKGFEQPVKLEVKEIFTGAAARYFRARLAAVGIQEIAQQRLAEYAARYEGAMRDGAPFLQDSLGRNSVTMIDRYLIPAPMEANATKPKPFYLHHAELNGGLQRPEAQQRQVPYAVYYPYYRQHRVQLALPEGYTAADRFAEEAKMVEHPAFHAEYRQYKKAGQWVMTSEVKFLQASVKAEAFEAFQQAAQEWDQATPATTIVPTSNSVEGGVNWWAKGWVGFL